MDASQRPRHGRSESVAMMSGSSWLPPFTTHVQQLLNEPVPPVSPLSFVPVDWVQTTFPNIDAVKGGKLEGYIQQLRRTMKDLSKTREVQSDQSASHSLVLHSVEGMMEAYGGLLEGVKAMVKFSEQEVKQQSKDDSREDSKTGTTGGSMNKLEKAFSSTSLDHSNAAPSNKLPPTNPASNGGGGAKNNAAPPRVTIPTDSDDVKPPFKIVVTPSHRGRGLNDTGGSVHSNKDGATGGGGADPATPASSITTTGGAAGSEIAPSPASSTSSASAGIGMESPYTPRVYQETPLPSPSKPSTTHPPPSMSAAATIDPNSAEGKKLARQRKMQELQQDHTALLAVKRHCIKTLRALRNVHVLVSAVDCLKDILADKEFQAARLAFQAITEIFHTLYTYSKLPLLKCLNDHVECYKASLRKLIFESWREHMGNTFMNGTFGGTSPMMASPGGATTLSQMNGTAAQALNPKQQRLLGLTRLHHCCRLIDSLYSSFERKELVKWWITVELSGYTQQVSRKVFGDVYNPQIIPGNPNPTLTGFDHLSEQFQWVQTELRTMWDAEYVQVFPKAWYVDALFVRKFFEILRQQICLTLEAQERRVKDENDQRRALVEAKKARQLMLEMQGGRSSSRLTTSGSNSNLSGARTSANGSTTSSKSGSSHDLHNGNDSTATPGPPQLTHADSYGSSASASPTNNGGSADDADTKPITFEFYKPLLRTIEFENQMRARWLNPGTESSLQEEDLFVVLGTVPNPALIVHTGPDGKPLNLPQPKNPPPYPFQFAGYISSAFHPYLPHMLLQERTRFYNFLETLDAEESWDVESADITTCHFSAATTLFVMIQKSMERYSKVMPGDAFLDLFKEYRTGILNYLELLSKHLPSSKYLEDEEVSSLCATINTSDYILDRCNSLANTIIHMLSGHNPEEEATSAEELTEEQSSFVEVLKEQVDLTQVEEQVSHLNHKATHVLANSIVQKLAPALQHMREGRGSSGKEGSSGGSGSGGSNGTHHGSMPNGGSIVNDENKYVREIIYTLRQQLTDKAKMSSFAYLTQVIAQDFFTQYHQALKQVKFKITEPVAQQMLLDLQSLKNFLLHGIPEMKQRASRASVMIKPGTTGAGVGILPSPNGTGDDGPHTFADGSSSALAVDPPLPAAFKPFVKLVNTQSLLSENLLKSLGYPNSRLIDAVKMIFPKADHKAVYEILNLRGLTSGDQEKLVKSYNATVKNLAEQIPIIKKDFFGNISQMVRDAKHVMQS